MNCFKLLISLFFIFTVFIGPAEAVTISIDGTDQGRAFEGIGAVSAGGNSRLLIDYEDPYRSDVLDFLFKPKFGANFHHLKVELGGGTNSTTVAVASHAITEDELTNPVSRSYQLWLMKKARDLNPDIILDCLAWSFPYWFDSEYCQDTSNYIVSFLDLAKNEWGLDMNWVGGCLNEAWSTDNSWLKNSLRPTLDSAGYTNVKIHAEERHGSHYAWEILDDCMSDPSLDAVVDAVSAHYVEDKAEWPTSAQIAFGKPMWDSEQSVGGGGWSNAIDIVRTMTRDYVEGKITKQEIWCPVDSAPDGVFLGATGAMQADSPWSGAYDVRPAIWGVAHYNQFAEPGWLYIDSGCGTLTGAGNYATLKDPVTNNWSIIIYSESAETLTFQLSGGLSAADVKVWKSTSANQFVQQSSISQTGGQFTISCSADSLYSLTTTTGQQKGVHSNTTKLDLPLPYVEDFENYTEGQMPSYLSDMQGTAQIQNCKGNRSGLCIQQMVPSVGYGWGTTQQRTQTLIPGPMTWNNYELSSDVYIENGEIYLAVRRGFPSWSWEGMTSGYSFVLEKNGEWALHFDQPDDDSNRLANGTIANFDGSLWHNVKVRSVDEKIEASVDGAKLFTITDSQRSSGNASIGGTFDSNQFDNISVRKTGRQWNVINQIDSSITWVEYWWYYAGSWFFNGDCSYTSTTNASATFPFSGVAGRVIGTKRSDCGILDVYVDDVYKTSVDCYSETEDNGQILYETEDLSSGNHTIKVVVTGQKNAASSNPQIILGGFSSTTAISCSTVKTNFALTATASASSIWDSGYTAAMANDGDVISRWNSAGNDVNGSWLEMDFGQEVTFNKTKLTQLDNRIQSYKIQYDDGQWKDAYTGGQLGTGSTDSFPAVTGTKVRLYVVSATAVPSIYEFEVYSAQTDFDDDGRVNFADLAWLCTRWLEDDCDQSCDCQGADVYRDGTVDLQDFSVFFEEYNP